MVCSTSIKFGLLSIWASPARRSGAGGADTYAGADLYADAGDDFAADYRHAATRQHAGRDHHSAGDGPKLRAAHGYPAASSRHAYPWHGTDPGCPDRWCPVGANGDPAPYTDPTANAFTYVNAFYRG